MEVSFSSPSTLRLRLECSSPIKMPQMPPGVLPTLPGILLFQSSGHLLAIGRSLTKIFLMHPTSSSPVLNSRPDMRIPELHQLEARGTESDTKIFRKGCRQILTSNWTSAG